AVKLIGNLPLGDEAAGHYPLAGLPQLHSLELQANEIVETLTPLARCQALRTLRLSRISVLRDLSGLAATAVRELVLQLPGGGRLLAGVARCRGLGELALSAPVTRPEVEQLTELASSGGQRLLRVPGADPAHLEWLRRELPGFDVR